MIKKSIIEIVYLISSIIFIFSLKYLSNPQKARQGNILAAGAMGLAILVTLFDDKVNNLGWILSGMIVGSVIGVISSKKIRIQVVPQIISFFNGMGGACAALICLVQFKNHPSMQFGGLVHSISMFILFGIFIGTSSFAGSLVIMAKHLGWIPDKSIQYPLQKTLNLFLLLIVLSVGAFALFKDTPDISLLFSFFALCFLYGTLFVLPVSGKEITVLSSFLNALTGITALMLGLIFENQIMMIAGILVGSSGFVLAIFMSRVMNRSLLSILFFRGKEDAKRKFSSKGEILQEISPSDAAILLGYSRRVMIVPGFGLATSGAHYVCRELETILESRGSIVKYAVHPLAGRMPGHISILLAEANVPYTKILDIEEANREFSNTDLVFVIGANDIINPKEREEKISPVLGIPTLDIMSAKNILVLNRNIGSGYVGLENSAFFSEKTRVITGDAKHILHNLNNEILKN